MALSGIFTEKMGHICRPALAGGISDRSGTPDTKTESLASQRYASINLPTILSYRDPGATFLTIR